MVNFILPNFYYNSRFNNYLANYIKVYPQHLNFSENINIFAQEGNFPFSFWHGKINTNQADGEICLYPDMFEYKQNTITPIIFDCTNIYLSYNQLWLKDAHFQSVMNMFANSGCYVKTHDDSIRKAILDLHPHYFFITTNEKEYDQNYDFIITNNCDFKPYNKTIYTLNNRCEFCKKDCLQRENLNQFTFSSESLMTNCPISIFNVEQLSSQYEKSRKMGYTYFRFEEISINLIEEFNKTLLNFFIKPEFQENFLRGLIKND